MCRSDTHRDGSVWPRRSTQGQLPWPKRHMAGLSHHSGITLKYARHGSARPPSLFTVSLDVVDCHVLPWLRRLRSS